MLIAALPSKAQVSYSKSIEAGGASGIDKFTGYSFGADIVNGANFKDRFLLGIGVGFRYTNALQFEVNDFEQMGNEYLVPLYLRLKTNLTKKDLSPFVMLNIGNTFDVGKHQRKNIHGLMIEPAIGVDYNISESIGLYLLVGFHIQNAEYESTQIYEFATFSDVVKGNAYSVDFRVGMKF